MKEKNKIALWMGFLAVIVLVCSSSVYAEKWSAFEFKGDELYQYQIQWGDDELNTAIYTLKIEETADQKYMVEYGTKVEVDELSSELAFGYWGAYGPSLHLMFWNPMYQMLFSQLELKVGEQMSYYDMGKMQVTSKETIAGRTGYVCRLIGPNNGEPKAEWVIDPNLALPLRSNMLEENGNQAEIVLLKYEQL